MSSQEQSQQPSMQAEDLSRMEGEYGAKMIGKLKQMSVLIIGLRGLGVETAKNLILAGPRTVTIHDDQPAKVSDLGANFYLTEADVGKPRAQALHQKLIDLNPNCHVVLHTGQIDNELLSKHQVVCVCDTFPLSDIIAWNNFCRSQVTPIAFIYARISGVTGHVFSDFGNGHNCYDEDGVPVRQIVVDHITNDKHGVVTVDAERGHMLRDGDLIRFEEVRGMSTSIQASASNSNEDEGVTHYYKHDDVIQDINSICEIRTTKNPKKFTIGDTTKLGKYETGGLGIQVKPLKVFKFTSFESQICNPTFINGYMDFTKFGRDVQLHTAYVAIDRFFTQHGYLPRLHSEDDAKTVLTIAQAYAEEQNKLVEEKKSSFTADVDADVIRKIALYVETEISPLAALFGGVVAQEITKQAGKYTPIQQFFYYDAFELLDDQIPQDSTPVGSRYDNQIALFGRSFQEKLQKQRVFLVGCGALGCEYMKALAMTGLGIKGEIHATDDDRIELSNLNRQFLFRRKHVGKSKSKSAAESAADMNPELGKVLKAHEIRVEPKTEDVFDDKFWESLDFVINALDNMHARKYTDSKCVFYEKPLFESGTLGTQANTVICLPHKTPSYSEGAVAGEDQGIAKCTLRNFPSDIVHCIEWAREKFDDTFVSGADNLNAFLTDREGFFAKLKQDPLQELEALKSVQNWINLSSNPTFDTCVKIIFDEFIANFRNAIKDLTHAFPADARVTDRDTGADLGPFWHGHKRFPTAAEFDPSNDLHIDYIYHGANILATLFGLPERSREVVKEKASQLKAPEWKYSGAVQLDEKKGEEAKAEVKDDDREQVKQLVASLSAIDFSKIKKLNVNEFEKDDDKNHHVDWITAASNLRAFNYSLKPATRQKCRMTAGRIIPALATTTATITGFVMVEVFKYIREAALEKYRAATINLGTNTYVVENLPDPIKKKTGRDPQTFMDIVAIPEGFTVWDKVVINAPGATLQEFIDMFAKQHYGAQIDMVSTPSGAVLYNSLDSYDPKKKELNAEKLKTKVIDLYTKAVGPVFPENRNYLVFDVTVEDESGNTGIVPIIKYIFA